MGAEVREEDAGAPGRPDEVGGRLALAMAEMPMPRLDKVNPRFGSRYSSLGAVMEAVRPALARHGLAVSQSIVTGECGSRICTYVCADDGSFEPVGSVPVTLPENPQGAGSALTYYRRYALQLAFGLVGDEDDDGNAASSPASPVAPRREPDGPFTARCRTCGRTRRLSGPERWEAFLASDEARCCARPDWVAQ